MKERTVSPIDGSIAPSRSLPSELDAYASLRRARSRAAHPYIARWRPTLLAAVFAAVVALTIAAPESARAGVVATIGVALVVTCVAAALVRSGADARITALVVTLLDVPLIVAWALETGSVGEALSALVGVVLTCAWLFGPQLAIGVGVVSVAATMAVWSIDGAWAEPQLLPDLVWIIVLATALAVLLAREVETALLDSTRTMRRTSREMHELAALRRRLVTDVSHELRTPLTAINGFLDTVLREDIELDSPRTTELLRQARQGGDRLETLVARLLDIEGAQLGALPLRVVPVPLAEAIATALDGVACPAGRSIEVAHEPASVAGRLVAVDQERFTQLLANVVGNALEHGHGAVAISCTAGSEHVCVDVRDEGSGLPSGAEQLAFDPFTTLGRHRGSHGLGLSLARALARAHGGSLEYVAATDATPHAFRLTVPLA